MNNRQVSHNNSMFFLRSRNIRSRLFSTTGLGSSQQFHKSPVLFDSSHISSVKETTSNRNINSSNVEVEKLVSSVGKNDNFSAYSNSTFTSSFHKFRQECNSRTAEKQSMENIRLADIWEHTVKRQGWSERAAAQLKFSWAKSTIKQYDRYIKAFESFCDENGHDFPPNADSTFVFADFLCNVADKSERPESLLKMHTAALACLYEGIGSFNPMKDPYIQRLVTALVKAGTKRPAKRTSVMPIKPFYD